MNMKKLLMITLAMLPCLIWAQLGGAIKKDGRKLITDQPFVISDSHEGSIFFKISVDAEGTITAIDVVDDKTTIRSTPAKIKATNYVKKFKFEEGTWFPKHHQGTVRLSLIRKKNQKEE